MVVEVLPVIPVTAGAVIPGVVAAMPVSVAPMMPATSSFAFAPSRAVACIARSVSHVSGPAVRYGVPLAAVACDRGPIIIWGGAVTIAIAAVVGWGVFGHDREGGRTSKDLHAGTFMGVAKVGISVDGSPRGEVSTSVDLFRALDGVMSGLPARVAASPSGEVTPLAEVEFTNGVRLSFTGDATRGPTQLRMEIVTPQGFPDIGSTISAATRSFVENRNCDGRFATRCEASGITLDRDDSLRYPILARRYGKLEIGCDDSFGGEANRVKSWLAVHIPFEWPNYDTLLRSWVAEFLRADARGLLYYVRSTDGMRVRWGVDQQYGCGRWEFYRPDDTRPT